MEQKGQVLQGKTLDVEAEDAVCQSRVFNKGCRVVHKVFVCA